MSYSPECVEGVFSEVRMYGVLRNSSHASNHKQRKIYAVWGMCQNAQPCYGASQ